MSDRRRRFVGLKDLIHDNVRQGLSAGLTALGDLVKPAKQLLEDEPIITLQCGKVVMESTPRRMRTELWMSSLHRKGVGVAAAEKYEDMLMHKVTAVVVSLATNTGHVKHKPYWCTSTYTIDLCHAQSRSGDSLCML